MCYGSILSDSLCRASKSVRCTGCDRMIEKGDVKRVFVIRDEDDASLRSGHWCETCAAIAAARNEAIEECEAIANDDYHHYKSNCDGPEEDTALKIRNAIAALKAQEPK